MAATILIVDDEPDLVDTLRFSLEREGYGVLSANDGPRALELIRGRPAPDLVLLDLMLPTLSGTEVCRLIRMAEETRSVPVIMVSARGDEIDRIVAFELGVDDYVVKPFSVRELLLRVRVILGRHLGEEESSSGELVCERLRVDLDGHWARVDGREVELSAREFRLLAALVSRRGRVQTRDSLLAEVWGAQVEVTTRTVDTHVQRLRRKLDPVGHYIETLRGVGYRFVASDEPAHVSGYALARSEAVSSG